MVLRAVVVAGSAPQTPVPSVKLHGLCSCTAAADINCSVGASVSSPSSQSEDAVGKKASHPGRTRTAFHLTGKQKCVTLFCLYKRSAQHVNIGREASEGC